MRVEAAHFLSQRNIAGLTVNGAQFVVTLDVFHLSASKRRLRYHQLVGAP